jgi:hypothetical protein
MMLRQEIGDGLRLIALPGFDLRSEGSLPAQWCTSSRQGRGEGFSHSWHKGTSKKSMIKNQISKAFLIGNNIFKERFGPQNVEFNS